jgi:hypothetical protein
MVTPIRTEGHTTYSIHREKIIIMYRYMMYIFILLIAHNREKVCPLCPLCGKRSYIHRNIGTGKGTDLLSARATQLQKSRI